MLKAVHIKNFKSIKDCLFEFQDFQVLVGSNGSGKSSFLQALDVVGRALRHELVFDEAFHDAYHWRGDSESKEVSWLFEFEDGTSYELRVAGSQAEEQFRVHGRVVFSSEVDEFGILNGRYFDQEFSYRTKDRAQFQRLAQGRDLTSHAEFLAGMRRYHLDPVKLASQGKVAHKERPILHPDGTGLVTVLDYLLASERRTFALIEDSLREFVPRFQELLLQPGSEPGTRVLGIRDREGWEFKADQISSGLLLFLGYLVLVHGHKTRLLMLEEPENGIHPRRLQEVVEMTKHLASTGAAKVIMASHSPYLLDFVEKDEVYVVMRDERTGHSSITPLLQMDGAAKRASDYYTGELVFNFSEGDLAS